MLFLFDTDLCLRLQVGCGGAGDRGNDEHREKGKRVTVQCKINPHIGVSKKAVNAYNTNDRSENAIEIAGRKTRNRNDDHQINKRSIQNILRGNPHEHTKERPEGEKRDRDEDVVQYGVCMQMPEFTGKKFWGGQEMETSFLLGTWDAHKG